MHPPSASAGPLFPHDTRLLVAVTGFIAGHAVLPTVWFHAGWLIIGALGCLRGLRMPSRTAFLPVWLFLAWMTLRSLFSSGAETTFGLLSVSLLVVALVLFANARDLMDRCGRWTGQLAAAAAAISVGWHLWRWGFNFEDFRLENLLVYGGLNAVCTGMIFGFAALWLCALPLTRWSACCSIVLTTATFCTGSRGAMLALLAGHAVLLRSNGWRKGWLPPAVLVTSFALYSTTGLLKPTPVHAQASPPELTFAVTAPVQKALSRSNQGRLDIYRAGWSCLDTPLRHVVGIGQWGMAPEWQRRLSPSFVELSGHLHSAYIATYVCGGIVGAGLLLWLLARVVWIAVSATEQGRPLWPSLLAFGMAALVFDGESFAHLLTLPRFETLLFWLPATLLLADHPEIAGSRSEKPAGNGGHPIRDSQI